MTIADKIVAYLADNYNCTPMEIARALNLNANSVRRTTRELALNGEIIEESRYRAAPVYILAPAVPVASETV